MFLQLLSRLALPLLATCAALPAQIDRESQVPVDAQHLRLASLQDIQNLSAQGYRMSNFEINQINNGTVELNCTMIRNTGPFQANWLFVYDRTRAQLINTLNSNNMRIVDLERYLDNGTEKLAALLFVNSGQQQKSWFWHTGIPQGSVWSTVDNMGNRIIDLEPYQEDGQQFFHVVSIANSGPDQKAWWVYTNTTPGGVQSYMDQHDARLYDFESLSLLPSVVACVLVRDSIRSKTFWGEFYGSGFDLDDEMGGRVTGLGSYSLGVRCITLIDNIDPFWEYGNGCAGTNGHASHYGLGTAFTGTSITFKAENLRPWTIALVFYGMQTAFAPLAPIGAPGCSAYVDPITSLTYYANPSGVATIPFSVPANPALHNLALVSQVLALDPGINALGAQTSNGLITRIRSW